MTAKYKYKLNYIVSGTQIVPASN